MEDRIKVLQKAEERAKKLEAAVEEQRAAVTAGSVDDSELKKILLYLDDLLAHLPDNVIAEFSESEYFELYDKVLRRLGI
jgi:pilus assembly protein FimV